GRRCTARGRPSGAGRTSSTSARCRGTALSWSCAPTATWPRSFRWTLRRSSAPSSTASCSPHPDPPCPQAPCPLLLPPPVRGDFSRMGGGITRLPPPIRVISSLQEGGEAERGRCAREHWAHLFGRTSLGWE